MRLKKPYHHGNLKHALIHAALDIIAHKGLDALSLRQTAKQAGVSPAAPYRHFSDKATLLAAIAAHGFEDLSNMLKNIIRRYPQRPDQQLFASAQAYIEWMRANQHMMQIMFLTHDSVCPALDENHECAEKAVLGMIEEGQKMGFVKSGDPQEYFLATMAYMHGLSTLLFETGFKDHVAINSPRVLIRRLTEIMWFGMAKSPARQLPELDVEPEKKLSHRPLSKKSRIKPSAK